MPLWHTHTCTLLHRRLSVPVLYGPSPLCCIDFAIRTKCTRECSLSALAADASVAAAAAPFATVFSLPQRSSH